MNLSFDDDAESEDSITTLGNKDQQARKDSIISDLNISLKGPFDCTIDDILALKGDKKELSKLSYLRMSKRS